MHGPLQPEDEDLLEVLKALLLNPEARRNPRILWNELLRSIRISGLVFTASKTLSGMAKGRESRFGDTQEREKATQRFLDDFRVKYPQASNNVLIRAAVNNCKVSESFIRRHLRDGSLTIKTTK